ncbi:hypothetical protein OH491_13520 [Termitidicoccus mucosus]|uniref:Uncharacterized protein n=1 Tax=Termitidicoccus mucosus TaxID=1184151 RepID=A0A178IJQ0_9BACT|nr:hypothetical protein AW736_13930 [Opitutaceae bacterium TSB47]
MADDNTTLEILIKIRDELAGANRAREELQKTKVEATESAKAVVNLNAELARVKGDLAALQKTNTELANLKQLADAGTKSAMGMGTGLGQATLKTENLQRANMLLAGVLSGNVVGAVNAVRGVFVSMMGPLGLALAAVTAVGMKLYSIWQAGLAAEAARAADEFAWSLDRARESADDLAKASASAFATALTEAMRFYDEAGAALERQFEATQRIRRAELALAQVKIRNDSSLSPEQKIIKEQQLIADLEALTLADKAKLLADQKRLAEEAKTLADRELEVAQTALAAAREKPKDAWIDTAKVDTLKAAIRDLQAQAASSPAMLRGMGVAAPEDEENPSAPGDFQKGVELQKQIDSLNRQIAQESELKTIEENRARAMATLGSNLAAAEAGAQKTASGLDAASQRLQQFKDVDLKVAEIEKETADERAKAQAGDRRVTTTKQLADETAKVADIEEQSALAQIRHNKEIVASNPDLTRIQRQEELNKLIAEEGRLLSEMIDRRAEMLESGELSDSERAALEARIDALVREIQRLGGGVPTEKRDIDKARDNYTKTFDGSGLTAGEGVEAGLLNYSSQLGTVGNQFADFTSGTLLDTARGITDEIYNWAAGTGQFGDALLALGDTVFRQLLDTLVQMGIQWVMNTALIKTGMVGISATQDAIRTQQTGKTVAANAAVAASAMPGAVASGISSFGVALIFGALALALVLAAASAFAGGGRVRGRNTLAVLNDGSDGDEFVIRGASRAKYGDSMLSQINAGTYDPAIITSSLAETPFASLPAAQLTATSAPSVSSGGGVAALASALGQPPAPNITQRFFMDWAAARNDILTSGDFRDTVRDITREFFRMNS